MQHVKGGAVKAVKRRRTPDNPNPVTNLPSNEQEEVSYVALSIFYVVIIMCIVGSRRPQERELSPASRCEEEEAGEDG